METFKCYGMKMGDLAAGATPVGESAGRGVPKKFLETPERLRSIGVVRSLGFLCFVFCVLC